MYRPEEEMLMGTYRRRRRTFERNALELGLMVFPKPGQDVLFELGGVVVDDDLDGYIIVVTVSIA